MYRLRKSQDRKLSETAPTSVKICEQQGNIVKIATGYVVRVLVDEPESKLCAMLGRGTIATITEIFPYNTIEVESVAGIRQFYPEDELELLGVM